MGKSFIEGIIKSCGGPTPAGEFESFSLKIGEHTGWCKSEGIIEVRFDMKATKDLQERLKKDLKSVQKTLDNEKDELLSELKDLGKESQNALKERFQSISEKVETFGKAEKEDWNFEDGLFF